LLKLIRAEKRYRKKNQKYWWHFVKYKSILKILKIPYITTTTTTTTKSNLIIILILISSYNQLIGKFQ
jgi:hypothetical protein